MLSGVCPFAKGSLIYLFAWSLNQIKQNKDNGDGLYMEFPCSSSLKLKHIYSPHAWEISEGEISLNTVTNSFASQAVSIHRLSWQPSIWSLSGGAVWRRRWFYTVTQKLKRSQFYVKHNGHGHTHTQKGCSGFSLCLIFDLRL